MEMTHENVAVIEFLTGAAQGLMGDRTGLDAPAGQLGYHTGTLTRLSMASPGTNDFKGVEAGPLANLLVAWAKGMQGAIQRSRV